MIEKPRLDQLTDHFNSPYELVVAVAKRARQLNENAGEGVHATHPLSQALNEARDGHLHVSPKD